MCQYCAAGNASAAPVTRRPRRVWFIGASSVAGVAAGEGRALEPAADRGVVGVVDLERLDVDVGRPAGGHLGEELALGHVAEQRAAGVEREAAGGVVVVAVLAGGVRDRPADAL